jgi:methionine-rich copper-binding protein CopC
MKKGLCFGVLGLLFGLSGTMLSGAVEMSDLGPLSIASGERVVFSNLVDEVTLSGGETAWVTANFDDTSVLAPGRHTLVYTACSLTGRTEEVVTTLDVDFSAAQTNVPSLSGIKNLQFTEGAVADLRKDLEAFSSTGMPLETALSLPHPEQLAPGMHTLYYTVVDSEGHSLVDSCSLQVLPLTEAQRRAEWRRLGAGLYEKYFEPTELTPFFKSSGEVLKVFGFGSTNTIPGISAHISFRDVEFDMAAEPPQRLKLERLTARMLLLLKELQLHRRLWLDQPQVVMAVDLRAYQTGTGQKKERGIYSLTIPISVFQQPDFDVEVLRVLQSLPSAVRRSRSDNKGEVCHLLYTDPTSGIRILYEQDLIESSWSNAPEKNFDGALCEKTYLELLERFDAGDFGAFIDPTLPFLKQQNRHL